MNKRLEEIDVLYNDGVNLALLNRLLNTIENELNEYEKISCAVKKEEERMRSEILGVVTSDSNSYNVVIRCFNGLHIDSDGEINSIGSQFG